MRRSASLRSPLLVILFVALTSVLVFTATGGTKAEPTTPAWSEISLPNPPPARTGHTAIYDAMAEQMVVFGGYAGPGSPGNDIWTLSLSGSPAWAQLNPAGTPPGARYQHRAIYDRANQRMIVFGGGGGGKTLNDVWALSLSGPPSWTELAPAGGPPPAWSGPSAIYDPINQRMILFGGSLTSSSATTLNDVWSLSLSGPPVWTELTPQGIVPLPRYGHTAIYDDANRQMVVFGGCCTGASFLNDVWALSLSGTLAWTQLSPTGSLPLGRATHSAVYDAINQQMLIYGGQTPGLANDLWALSLSGSATWTQLSPPGTAPSVFYDHSAVFDSVNRRMLIFGGNTGANPSNRLDPRPVLSNGLWALGPLSDLPCPATPTALPTAATPLPINSSITRALYLPLVTNSWCKP